MKQKLLIFSLIFLAFFVFQVKNLKASVDPNFDPNFIISDEEMLNTNSMSLLEIQNFLESKNSYLATYQTLNAYGTLKTAAEIIYDAATANYRCPDTIDISENPGEEMIKLFCEKIRTVNPKFLIILIQKESSLIENPNPIQRHLDQATGYGCPDSGGCDPRWHGFGKQVNSAALQFLAYMQYPNRYPYRQGKAYVFNNNSGTIYNQPLMVTPANYATAALYNYTPHVFNGNYNVWRLYQRYFPESVHTPIARYPNGSLLQVKDQPGVWLIQNGQKRPFLSWGALTSRYNPNRIITIDESELDAYYKGAPLKYPNYSLLRSPQGEIYLIVDDEKRLFATNEIFKHFGFHPDEIIDVSSVDLSYYQVGNPITNESTHITGALLQDPRSGGVFYVHDGQKAPINDRVVLEMKYPHMTIYPATVELLNSYTTIDPVLFNDGNLLKSRTVSTVYLIADGQKRPFISGKVFEDMGYKWENIIEVSPQHLYLYPFGELVVDSLAN
jgi:hypothetical protein